MNHKTKEKGDLGVAKVIADLTEQGFDVLLPISEHLPFDLVVFDSKSGRLLKVQVKCRTLTEGRVDISLRNTAYNNTRGMYAVPTDISAFDLYAVYCPETKKCYYINTKDIKEGTKHISLRIEGTQRNLKLRLAKDFETLKI